MTKGSWPAVTWETRSWRPRQPQLLSARQRAALPTTYRSAIPATIATASLELPGELLAREAGTVAAIGGFDAVAAGALQPWTDLLLRSESSASSRIERLTSSARKVIEEETFGGAGGNATAVVANTRAMQAAISRPDDLNTRTLLDMHRELLAPTAPDIAGVLRDEPVWIGGQDYAPVDALFVPPAHTRVPEALADLVAFTQRPDITPLAMIAIAHAQFETIHPFADGNGRTGRALIHLLLRRSGLVSQAVLPLSAVLLTDTNAYFHTLDAYRAGDPAGVVSLFVDAARAACELGLEAVAELNRIQADWNEHITARAGTPDRDLTSLLIRHPILDVATTAQELKVSPQSARRSLARLEQAGIVVGYQMARGRRAWRAPDVLALMDRVTAGIRRS
ncbi:Fic family protein [Actinomyces sp.]|uniref:Fic family protein n=1 Tax=Actinomyces sp. TaxID=29317 RepID=UPI0026DBCA1F|nr:Fic family protein [Actinomyces sp.]MDO4899670.1 Fic family protein [Actinomyces sp.]